MKIVADTNVLLRAAVRDDPEQARAAADLLRSAQLVAVPVSTLCEFVWVMRRAFNKPSAVVAESLRSLVDSSNVVTDRLAVEAGLEFLERGGDFADGAIAYQGAWMGAEEFVSFDNQAVTLLRARGRKARLLS